MSSNPAVVIGVSAVDTARQTLSQVDAKIRETTQVVEESGSKITTIGEKIKSNWQSLAGTATGLVVGITSFATSFDVLNKAQTNADRANLTYEKSLAKLEDMQKQGKQGSEEYARQEEQVRINLEKSNQAADNLNDTYVNFLANVPAQMLSFGTAAISMFTLLKTAQAANAATSVASAVTYDGALASMGATTVATTGAVNAFRLASIAAFITNPVGLAIIGITTVVVLLVTHFDELVAAARAVADFFAGPFKASAESARGSLDSLNVKVDETIALTDSIGVSVKRAANDTDTATKAMSDSWVRLTSDIEMQVEKQKAIVREVPNPIGDTLRITEQPQLMIGSIPLSSLQHSSPASSGASSSSAVGLGGGAATAGYFNSLTSGVKKNALGGAGMVYQPTLFLAGENGPEGFKFTPGKPASDGSIGDLNITIIQKGTDIDSVEVEIAGRRRKKYSLRKQGVYGGH